MRVLRRQLGEKLQRKIKRNEKMDTHYNSNINWTLEEALFHDGTSDFCRVSPEGENTYTFVLRTLSEKVDRAVISINDEDFEMESAEVDGIFEYFELTFEAEDELLRYYFKIESEGRTIYYDKLGVNYNVPEGSRFELTPGFDVPEWAKGAVMYQVYVDRFYSGDRLNDVQDNEYSYIGEHVKKISDWYKLPDARDVFNFYGGDLQGVIDKMDYFQKLGVEVIYFNPIFVSPSNHKYDTQDYDHVDPHIGKILRDGGMNLADGDMNNRNAGRYIMRTTHRENLTASNRLFAKLVREAHKRNIKVIIDGVFNHCGSFNKWLDKEGFYHLNGSYKPGAYGNKDSSYDSFFKFFDDNHTVYEGWWGFDTLPKLNYEESQKLCDYIMKIGAKWVSEPYNVDGWRLDVAADLGHSEEFNHKFWRRFRRVVKKANPNAIILAEHYGSPKSWLMGDQWDTVMNYDAFMEPVTWFLTGVDKHSDNYNPDLKGNARVFFESMRYNMLNFQTNSMLCAMNQLSNHDHSRFLTRTNSMVGRTATVGPEAASLGINKHIMKEAVVMQMTLPGAPTLYYGDEAGLCGWTDPDNRRTYPWGREDLDLLEFHRDVIAIHKQNKVFRTGAYIPLYENKDVISYGRFSRDSKAAIIINNSGDRIEVKIPVWRLGVEDGINMKRILLCDKEQYNIGAVDKSVTGGEISVTIGPFGAAIYISK